METLRDKWLRFGCFLTGYNYLVVKGCSELSRKRVIKYTSSLLIICLLWGFIGFIFTARYLKGEWYSCIIASCIMVFLAIQIERQIILSSQKNIVLIVFRSLIAITMALIGTVIIDQMLFKEDIDKRKLLTMDEQVKKILPGRAEELRKQIAEINSAINAKEVERKSITDDLQQNPYVTVYERIVQRDTAQKESVTTIKKMVLNPKGDLLGPLDKAIKDLRFDKNKKDTLLLGLRPVIELELKQNVGFLDELNVMYSLLSESGVARFAWLIWVVFLFCLELLILVSKSNDPDNDYDRMMEQQMQLHFTKIDLLTRKSLDT